MEVPSDGLLQSLWNLWVLTLSGGRIPRICSEGNRAVRRSGAHAVSLARQKLAERIRLFNASLSATVA